MGDNNDVDDALEVCHLGIVDESTPVSLGWSQMGDDECLVLAGL
jgi:hypothetical protein